MTTDTTRNFLGNGHLLLWYKIEEVLGKGGFGITYLAHDMNLDRKVAIKEYIPVDMAVRGETNVIMPHKKYVEDFETGRNRFIREARTMAKFEHPNIVRVLNVFEENETAYTAMAYEEGRDLKELLHPRKTLSEERILKIFLPIIDGLFMVHQAGFIHRDIKPGNIMIRKDDTAVLIDFGSAHNTMTASEHVTALVSPGYTPHEQYTGNAAAQGPWTDIYSLAASMYRCIAGVSPADALSRGSALLKQFDDPLVPVTDVGKGKYSDSLLNGITAALQFDEANRPQNLDDWRAMLLGGRDFTYGYTSTTNRLGDTQDMSLSAVKAASKSNKGAIAAGLGAIVVGAAVAGWFGLGSKNDTDVNTAPVAVEQTQSVTETTTPMAVVEPVVGEVFMDELKTGGMGPEMILLPAGDFIIGSEASEKGRSNVEGPQQHVHITNPIAIGKTEITVNQFKQFVAATGYVTEAEQDVGQGCRIYDDGWRWSSTHNWKNPGFPQSGEHPVVCVTWNDANAYIDWLSKETGQSYMLPSEAVWEYAARAGTDESRYWEATGSEACLFANISDLKRAEIHNLNAGANNIFSCNDGFVHTSPVGSFQENNFGLKDTLGNVWEWTDDCWNDSYETLPLDGSPLKKGVCSNRIYRGGSWGNFPELIRAAKRGTDPMTYRYYNVGFRVARQANT